MKLLKTYEMYIDSVNADENSEILQKYSFKIGEYVKILDSAFDDILQIVAINTEDPHQPYALQDEVGRYWFSIRNIKRLTEEELKDFLREKDAEKYNL